jgi:diguanylate cyclase (GGDEF)-like protein/PAS domain S-box-containing protein
MQTAAETRRPQTLNRHWLDQIVSRTNEGVLLIDARDPCMPVVYVNPAFESLTGYAADEIVGAPWQPLQREQDVPSALEELRAAVSRSEAVEVDLPDLRKDGSVWFSKISFSPLTDARGEIRYFLVLQRESVATTPERTSLEVGLLRRELGRAKQKIDNMNQTDQATGLLRYESFIDILNRDLAVARRDRRPVAIMLFEIVELDVYRKTFGSKAADSCMRMIGAQISGTLRRAGDLCARGGDCIVVASILGQEAAQAAVLVDKIVANVRGLKLHNPHAKSGRYISVSTALVGGVPNPEDDADTLVESAKRQLAPASGDSSRKNYG